MLLQDIAYNSALLVAMFQYEPAARVEVVGGLAADGADVVQTFCAGSQRGDGFKTQVALLQMRVAGFDIGRVADDEVPCCLLLWWWGWRCIA